MIHVTLIDYKKLYEDTKKTLEECKIELADLKETHKRLKELHNEATIRSNQTMELITKLKIEHLEEQESLCDLLGGEGALVDRILGAKECIEHQNKALEYAREEILRKDNRIAELMAEGITDENEALNELHASYSRLHDDYYSLKTLYDNAQKTIDKLCSND